MAKHFRKLNDEEYNNILSWASSGIGITEIVRRIDRKVSKQRVKQICDSNKIPVTQIKRDKQKKTHHEKMFKKWGSKWNDKEWRKSAIYDVMREKFRNKKAHNTRWEWDIDFGDIEFPTHCPMLGIELNYFATGMEENSPSFDRLNPKKGYVKGNVVIISCRANRIKNDGTYEEHQKIADFMKDYF
jgi:hypothetical protein